MGKPRHQWRRGSHEDFFRQVKTFSFSTYLSIKRTTLTPHMAEGSMAVKNISCIFADTANGEPTGQSHISDSPEGFVSQCTMVEPSGIEPLTSCMPCRRSPS